MFLEGKIELLVYRDAAQTEFPVKKVVDVSESFVNNSADEAQSTSISLAASGSQVLNFNTVGTTNYVYIYSDTADINVNINGLGNILFKAQIPSLIGAEITSLTVINSSALVATTVSVSLVTG